MKRAFPWIFVLLALLMCGGSAASAANRVALVIGNAGYAHAPTLASPINDATDIAAALRDIGFKVTEAPDLDKAALEAQFRAFVEAADGAEVALLYYAGHGIQVDGRNYVVPVDAKIDRRSSIDFELVDVDRIVSALRGAAKETLIFLDACRNNPFDPPAANGGTRSAPSRGLAPIQASGSGVLIALSTSPGKVAVDSSGRNSPFAAAMLRHMRTPGLDVNSLMVRVRNDVERATDNQQVPWVTESLSDLVYLSRDKPAAELPSREPSPCEKLVDPAASATTALASNGDEAVRACAEEFNNRPTDPDLAARLKAAKEQRTFKNALASGSRDGIETYLLLFPEGRYVAAARERLAALSPAPAPAPAPLPAPAPSVRQAPGRDLAEATRTLVKRYWAITNAPGEDGSDLAPFYADTVTFYGGPKLRNEIIRLKQAFFRDWNLRDYAAPEARVDCNGVYCTYEGVVDWKVTSEGRRVVSSGRSTFNFGVDWSGGIGKVVSEGGSTIRREAHKM